jgi:hypothetical protein
MVGIIDLTRVRIESGSRNPERFLSNTANTARGMSGEVSDSGGSGGSGDHGNSRHSDIGGG